MNTIVTGRTGTIGKKFPSSVYSFKSNLLENSYPELNQFSKTKFSLIHCAGIVGELEVKKDISTAWNVNVTSTTQLAEESLSLNVSKFIFVSTSHLYKPSITDLSESSEIEPQNVYAFQKLEAEKELLKLFELKPEKLIIARVFSVLDWGMNPNSLGGAIENLIEGNIESIINGSDERDFQTPKSISEILLKLSTTDVSGIINVCTSKSRKIKEVVSIMLAKKNRLDLLNKVLDGNSKNKRLVGNSKKLRKILPSINLDWHFSA